MGPRVLPVDRVAPVHDPGADEQHVGNRVSSLVIEDGTRWGELAGIAVDAPRAPATSPLADPSAFCANPRDTMCYGTVTQREGTCALTDRRERFSPW